MSRRVRRVVLTSCLSALSLAAAADGTSAKLLGFQRIADRLEFTVISTGCTTSEHFTLEMADAITPDNSNQDADSIKNGLRPHISITLIRIKNDYCRRMPGPKVISFSLPEDFPDKTTLGINNSFVSLRPR